VEEFGSYRLVKRLGAGGMGEVFLAQRSAEPSTVVVKRILPHLTENQRFLRLFLDETRIASRLHHANIAEIFELGEVQGTWFVAMEHVAGKDLRELLKRVREQEGEVPVDVAVYIAVEVARGLEYAHQATDAQGRHLQIVHRDVSPHNVLVTRTGEVKLIDFGVAKAANKSVHTATGILKGKFPYMAPEQAHARPVDARTDVFALGIVLWEMLTGRYLFRGKTDAVTLRLVRECMVPAPSSLREDVPEALDKVVLKALRKDPKDRYATAAAFREALEGVLANYPPPDVAGWVDRFDDVPGLEDVEEAFASESPDMVPEVADSGELATELDAVSRPTVPVRKRQDLTRSDRVAPALPRTPSGEQLEQAKKLLEQVSGRPTNIGKQPTSFVGRVAELADLHQLFRQGVRLITLLGPGGTGKTRLSLQFGQQLVSYFEAAGDRGRRRGGVWFCNLTESTDVDSICAAVARALSVPLVPGDPVKQLGHAILARGEVLLVMDNFEQVVAQAPDTIEKWMRAAPQARFVVSSRELLRVPEETVFEVPPLRTPKEQEAPRSAEAVELFIERARAVRPGWEPTAADVTAIAEVVRQLDGLPLAIELAAARMSVLSPTQLVQRLPRRFDLLVDRRGASERQATLRGAIDWSWRMLTPVEASAMAQLSVFRGGFSADAVEAVVLLEGAAALELLMTLRAKSLVRAYFPYGDDGQTRFGLFESIREYAKERLAGQPEEPGVQERHAAFYLSLGEKLSIGAEGSKAQLDALDLERDNLNAVFVRAQAAADDGGRSLRAVLALDPLLALRGPFQLHLAMLDAALAKGTGGEALRAAGLEARGRARQARGRIAESEDDLLSMCALAQTLGDVAMEARAEAHLATIDRLKGQRADARRRCERALALSERVGDRRVMGRTLSILGTLLSDMGQEAKAMDTYNEALELHRAVGDRRYEGISLANLGVQQQALGLLKQARANYQAALAIHRELGNRRSEGISHINLGDLNADLEQPGQARSHYESALAILREVGARRFEGAALVSLGSLFQQFGELDEAAAHLAEGIAILEETGDARYEGLGRAALAAAKALQGSLEEAEEGMAEATRLLTEAGDAAFLDALDLYRAHLELAHARQTRSDHQAAVLEERIAKRIAHAERAGPSDELHPGGVPSPADRSEHVRAALRSLRIAMAQSGQEA
jgi:predicted ATPase/serine/threonine protein kinase